LPEGLKWDWESFPEYLDALERLPRSVDVATHVPHGAVRAYVLGEPASVRAPCRPTKTSKRWRKSSRTGCAPACSGLSSRTIIHKSVDGEVVPGTTATADELIRIGRAMGRVGHGVFEIASDMKREWDEFGWMGALSRETGLPVTFAALQSIAKELPLSEQIAELTRQNEAGANIVAQIALRGNGIVMNWRGTVHPFLFRPSWAAIAAMPWEDQLAHLADPVFKNILLSEANVYPDTDIVHLYRVIGEGLDGPVRDGQRFRLRTAGRGEHCRARSRRWRLAGKLCLRPHAGRWRHRVHRTCRSSTMPTAISISSRSSSRATTASNSLSDGGAHCGTISNT
jgi:N-acyl-D-aspartate/D-glutamate deacylase